MSNSSDNICVDCGLCCDGTMFGQVINDLAESMVQPCEHLCNHCTIYDDRPTACRDYKCSLLLKHEDGNVTTQDALDIIRDTKSQLKPLHDLYEGLTFYQIMHHAFHGGDSKSKGEVLRVGIGIEKNFKTYGT